MKSVFYTFLFLVFTISAKAQFREMLDLSPEESARFDSTMRELAYNMEMDTFRNMPEEELKAIILNAIKQVLPADKAAAVQQLLIPDDEPENNEQALYQQEEYNSATEMPYPHLLLTKSQIRSMDDFEVKLFRKYDAALTTNAAKAMIEQHLYSILNEEQRKHFPDYQKAKEQNKIKIQRKVVQVIIPGFELNDGEILKLDYAEGERPWISSHQSYPDQTAMRNAYRVHLEKIVSPEKLRQFDDISAPLDKDARQLLLQRDSSMWFDKYQSLTDLYTWSNITLRPMLKELQILYGRVLNEKILGKMDSLRQLDNAIRTFRATTSNKELSPWENRYKTLEANYLQQFPNINLTVDLVNISGAPLRTENPAYFRKLRKDIADSIDSTTLKELSAALLEIENIQKTFMQQTMPGLAWEWFPVNIPPSAVAQNRILNFLLSMPGK